MQGGWPRMYFVWRKECCATLFPEIIMWRLARILLIAIAVIIVVWVIKELLSGGNGRKAGLLMEKIRLGAV